LLTKTEHATLPNALADDSGVRSAKTSPRHSGHIKEQAQALAAAQNQTEAMTVAGHLMERTGVPLLRLILAAAALLIIYVDPEEPDRHVSLTYLALAAYTACSAVVFLAAWISNRTLPANRVHWIDVAWHTLIVSLSSGTNSLFFFFYFFDILVASFRCGSREGLRVTAASALLFTVVGYAMSPVSQFELNKFLLRPIYLLILGYLIAYWGGLESLLRRRMTLLKEVTVLSNPRFGVDQTITSALEKLRQYYDADACLLVISGDADVEHSLYQARRGASEAGNPDICRPEMAAVLLAPPFSHAMLVEPRRFPWLKRPSAYIHDLTTSDVLHRVPDGSKIVLAALDAPAIVSVPFRYHHEAIGRLYVTGRRGTFDISDLEFLSHVIYSMLRVTDNVRLVDNLAYNAAENERQRIARGIHDTVIQPIIGLQIGLRAIVQRLHEGNYQPQNDIERLIASIDSEVGRMRRYVTNLKGEQRTAFMPAIRRFAREFRRLTGIDVEVRGPADLAISEQVSTALFGMTAEALSNIRRHTTSLHAAIVVERVGDTIEFRVENQVTGPETPAFTPRSLTEHAIALGGDLEVRRTKTTTAIAIKIPL
jgi:signal transduction histidine kinase